MKVINSKLALALAASLVSGVAIAGSAEKSGAMDFESLDQNGDGHISKSEAAASPELAKHWSKADANGDGQLDKSEFAKIETGGDTGEE